MTYMQSLWGADIISFWVFIIFVIETLFINAYLISKGWKRKWFK